MNINFFTASSILARLIYINARYDKKPIWYLSTMVRLFWSGRRVVRSDKCAITWLSDFGRGCSQVCGNATWSRCDFRFDYAQPKYVQPGQSSRSWPILPEEWTLFTPLFLLASIHRFFHTTQCPVCTNSVCARSVLPQNAHTPFLTTDPNHPRNSNNAEDDKFCA